MKKTIHILFPLLIISGCSFFGFTPQKNTVDLTNISAAYFSKEKDPIVIKGWEGTSETDLQLTADSCFAIFIQNANSDFPTEFSGKWKLVGTKITLTDTTEYKNAAVHLSVNEDGTLTGKYADHNFAFHKCNK